MKRLFKFLVASATSLSLLIANIPLTQVIVRADGDEPSAKQYTIKYSNSCTDGNLKLLNGDVEVAEDSYIYPGSTVSFSAADLPAEYTAEYVVTWDQFSETPDTVVLTSDSYTIGHYAKFLYANYVVNDTDKKIELHLELRTAYRITFESNIWCEFGVQIDGGSATNGLASLNYGLVRSNYVADSFKKESFDFAGDTINYISFEGFHRPGDVDNDDPDYEGYRFIGFNINDDDYEVISRYWQNKFYAGDLEDGTFDKNGNGLVSVKVTGDTARAVRVEWADSTVPDEYIQGNLINEHCVFDHGSAEILAILDADGNDISEYYDLPNCKDQYGNGGITVEVGYKIVFELIPEHGYQLETVNVNGSNNKPETDKSVNGANIYIFEVEDYCVHFRSTFVEEPDELKNDSNTVKQGNIDLNDSNLNGSGLVTVEDLSAAEEKKYEDEQWDNDLEVQAGFEIDLDNRFRIANTDDYWEKEVHDLDEDGSAWIALDLGEDFEPENENVKIIHITDDGETEYLDTKYDEDTHTVFFKTGGFSTFLVASTDKDVGPEAEVPDGFTAEAPQNNNDNPGEPGEPPKPGDPEPGEPQPGEPPVPGEEDPGEYVPRFDVALVDDEPALGNWEGDEEKRFFEYVEIGQAIPGDAEINNALPDDLPDDCKLIYFINGEEVASFGMDERGEPFSPGHFVTFEGIKVTESTCEVYFNECWVVGIDVIQMDLSMKAQDKDGKVIEPVGGSDKDGALIFECGDAGEEDFTYFEIVYPVCPAEVVVKGINDYAIFYLECNEKDMFNTPIGENSIEYPSEDDYIWIGAWGMVPDSETVNFTDSLTKVSAVFEGVSEDKIDDYLLLVTEFDTSDASEEEIAAFKKQIAEKGYDISEFPLGFDITLYDKNGEVHEPGFTVRITLVLEKALDLEDGETVLILHMLDDDKFEIIEAVYNAKNLTLTFETKSFSPFVVAFGTKAAPAAVVKTGETVNTTRIVIASILIGAAAAAGILFIRRRETEIEKKEN